MAGGFWFLLDTLTPLLAAENIQREAEDQMIDESAEILEYAKSNAPWSDITGDARNGLDIDVSQEGTTIVLTLFHTVDYGLWLEVIQNGKFATILPTLEHFSKQVLDSVGATETEGF